MGKSIFNTSESSSHTANYRCSQAGALTFALSFRGDQEARLRLLVKGPQGQQFQKEGTSAFVLEIPHGAVGQWECTVDALKVPYENFLFTLTMGGKQE